MPILEITVPRIPRFVNVGENPRVIPKNSGWISHRQWEGCRKYGFVSAGQGTRYSEPFKKLELGDYIVAFITGEGYVGIGKVIERAKEIKYFDFDGVTLSDLNIEKGIMNDNLVTEEFVSNLHSIKKTLFRNANDVEKSEYTVGVEWEMTVARNDAFWRKNFGLFASRSTQCSLENQPQTIKFIEDSFNVKFRMGY